MVESWSLVANKMGMGFFKQRMLLINYILYLLHFSNCQQSQNYLTEKEY